MRKALYFHFTRENTDSQEVKLIVQGHGLCDEAGFLTQEESLNHNLFSLKHSVLNWSSDMKIKYSIYIENYQSTNLMF